MAVAHETATESHTGTTASISEDFFDFSVPFTASSIALLVYTFYLGNPDAALSVKIDPAGANTDVPAVSGGRAADTAIEIANTTTWFLGSGLPTTTTTVRVNRSNTPTSMWAVAITVTAATAVEITGILLEQEDQALTEENINDGSPGSNSVRYAGVLSGHADVVTALVAGANSTVLHTIDFGARVISTVRETTAGQGSRPVGFVAASDDVAAVYLAVREVVAAAAPYPYVGGGYYPVEG